MRKEFTKISEPKALAEPNTRELCERAFASGQVEDFGIEWIGEGENLTCVCKVKRKGWSTVHYSSFSMKDARKAGLVNKLTWKLYDKRMLKARAVGYAMDDIFADVTKEVEKLDVDKECIDLASQGLNVEDTSIQEEENQEEKVIFSLKKLDDTIENIAKEDMYQYLSSLIEKINSNERLEAYKKWRNKNWSELERYGKLAERAWKALYTDFKIKEGELTVIEINKEREEYANSN